MFAETSRATNGGDCCGFGRLRGCGTGSPAKLRNTARKGKGACLSFAVMPRAWSWTSRLGRQKNRRATYSRPAALPSLAPRQVSHGHTHVSQRRRRRPALEGQLCELLLRRGGARVHRHPHVALVVSREKGKRDGEARVEEGGREDDRQALRLVLSINLRHMIGERAGRPVLCYMQASGTELELSATGRIPSSGIAVGSATIAAIFVWLAGARGI